MTQADRLLSELEATLLRLTVLLPDDKTVWDDNELLRLSVERLWIYAGTTAETYRITAGLDRGDQPWTELYEFRNILAHWTPGQANPARVWHESGREVPRLLDEVRSARTH